MLALKSLLSRTFSTPQSWSSARASSQSTFKCVKVQQKQLEATERCLLLLTFPAGRTSKASLRLHRHTLCTAGPHQGHRWSLLYSRILHIPPTLRHVSCLPSLIMSRLFVQIELYRLEHIILRKHKGVGWTLKFLLHILDSDLLIPKKCLCKY